jgi:carbon storage regulator
MLVLTRKTDESIIINSDIEIKVLKVGHNFVEIGIAAPRQFSIYRAELYREIQRKNLEAAKSLEQGDIRRLQELLKKRQLEKE